MRQRKTVHLLLLFPILYIFVQNTRNNRLEPIFEVSDSRWFLSTICRETDTLLLLLWLLRLLLLLLWQRWWMMLIAMIRMTHVQIARNIITTTIVTFIHHDTSVH